MNRWLTVVLTGVFVFSAAGGGARPLSLELLMEKSRPLNKECYGSNLQLQYSPIWFNHPEFIELYKETGKPFIRFPGGTTANFYNPETGLMSEDTPYKKHDFSSLNNNIRKFRNGGGNTDEGFLEFVKQTGSRYSVVLNVSTRTVAQNRAWLKSVKARGFEMTHFEIGNELYYNFFDWADAGKSAKTYISRAKESAAMIRSVFPKAKVGVIVPSHIYMFESYGGRQDKLPKRMQQWYDAMEKETFFDAVVIHLYSNIGMKSGTKVEDFISVAQGYENVIGYAERNLDSALDMLEKKFPDKEIWVTEYGVNGFNGTLAEFGLRDSHLGCLHSDLMLMRYFSRPSVSIAHWHSFNEFYECRHGATPGIKDERSNQYAHFSLFAEPVLNSEQYVPVKVDQGAQLEAGAFVGKSKGYVIVLNKRGETHSLKSLKSGKFIRLTGALQLTLSEDLSLATAMEAADKMERVELRDDALRSVVFPPYSITRLEYEFDAGQVVAAP
ncbi:glycoside hydrolase family protein [Pontiella sulfatireligans]|nr:hypothetical protein [Pontiella sulfatireligans]